MQTRTLLKLFASALIALTALGGPIVVSHGKQPDPALRDLLRWRIETGGVPLKISVGRELIHAAVALPDFYERRIYQPAWTDGRAALPRAAKLLNAVRRADQEGLTPSDYHLEKIDALFAEIGPAGHFDKKIDPGQLVDLDLLLTDAFLIYGSHLLAGRTNPEQIDPQWVASRRGADLVRLLEDALASNRVEETLTGLLPAYDGYLRLRNALALYRQFAATGGWPAFPSGSKLQKGDRGERIALLRDRLAAEGFDPGGGGDDPLFFNDGLEVALKNFQIQNGLEADGVLGPRTSQALDIPVDQRVRQIVVNMERWRWLPQNLGDRFVLVNIAAFSLKAVEQERQVLSMRVVAGKTYRKTPVFSDKITYLVINPYWGVPDKIAREDLLPKQKKNPKFFKDQKIRVYQGRGGGGREIDANAIDWAAVSAAHFPFRLKQDPGPQNALGRVKFMFPNKFDVYLHDTPSKQLFARARRDFSSGCIRVEKPLELTEYLLRNDPDWPTERFRSAMTGSDFTTQTVKLPDPVNIHILYWTVWVGEDGGLHFSPDVYDRDTALDAALRQPPPGSRFHHPSFTSPKAEMRTSSR